VNDFVPYRIQHQLGDGVNLEFQHEIASMRFCCFHCHVQTYCDFLGTLALANIAHRKTFGVSPDKEFRIKNSAEATPA